MRYPLITLRRPAPGASRLRRGFTLIESAMVTVIIGVGVVGMLELLAAGTVSNSEGTELTTAINLANNIREMSLGMAFYDPTPGDEDKWDTREKNPLGLYDVTLYDNVLDLDGQGTSTNDNDPGAYQMFSPPLDVKRQSIQSHKGWAQWVKVESVSEGWVGGPALPDTTTFPTARVTVRIFRNDNPVYTMSWLAVAPKAKPTTAPTTP